MSVPGGGYQPSNFPSGGYQGLGMYPAAGGPGPRRNRTRTVLLTVLAAVVVIAAAVTTTILVVNSDKEPQPVAASSDAAPTTTTSTTSSSTGKDPLQPKLTGPPLHPGWQVLHVPDTRKAYDVPPGWEIMTGSITFGSSPGGVTLQVPAIYKRNYCPSIKNSVRAASGLSTVQGKDAEAATTIAKKMADAAYPPKATRPTVEVGTPRSVRVDNNERDAVLVIAKITIPPGYNECAPPTATVAALTISHAKDPNTSIAFLAFADQGVPDTASEQDLTKIVSSMHGVG